MCNYWDAFLQENVSSRGSVPAAAKAVYGGVGHRGLSRYRTQTREEEEQTRSEEKELIAESGRVIIKLIFCISILSDCISCSA